MSASAARRLPESTPLPWAFTASPSVALAAYKRGILTGDQLAFYSIIADAWYKQRRPAWIVVPIAEFIGEHMSESQAYRVLDSMVERRIVNRRYSGRSKSVEYQMNVAELLDAPKYTPKPGTRKPPARATVSEPDTAIQTHVDSHICESDPTEPVEKKQPPKIFRIRPGEEVPFVATVAEIVNEGPVPIDVEYVPASRKLTLVPHREPAPPDVPQTHVDSHICESAPPQTIETKQSAVAELQQLAKAYWGKEIDASHLLRIKAALGMGSWATLYAVVLAKLRPELARHGRKWQPGSGEHTPGLLLKLAEDVRRGGHR